MKNKYYYNGELVRTSANDYAYGILRGKKIVACCSRKDLAEKRLAQEITHMEHVVKSNKRWLQEVINGEQDEYLRKYEPNKTKEQEIEETKALIARQESLEIKIVELEKK